MSLDSHAEHLSSNDPAESTHAGNQALHVALVAPGTAFRDGIDRIVRAKMGALLILGDSRDVLGICSGGFLLDTKFTPPRLSELAKMDGAIIISTDGSRLAKANVHLVPDPTAPINETGTHHRTSKRVALTRSTGRRRERGDERGQRARGRRQTPASRHRLPPRPSQSGAVDPRAVKASLDDAHAVTIADHFGELSRVLRATVDEFAAPPGITTSQAHAVKDTLDRLTESTILDQYI